MHETTRTRVGSDYEVLAELGHGGMAQVFKARHRQLGRTVALKVLPVHLLADDEARARFEREARAGAQLEHDHIVTTYDVGIHDGHPYLAVAFIEGETLAARIQQQGRLAPEETVRLLAPIAEALAYAHQRGVVHRDIKSSNIMIRREDERPMLIDFGIAHASFTRKLTRRGDTLGTPAYMSPEQARAQEIDYRSDLYSLGVVLYECLTGAVPFQSPNTEVLLANIKYEPHRPVHTVAPEVPAALSAVVDHCLSKAPDQRFEDGMALARALRAGLDAPSPPRRLQAGWLVGSLLLVVFVFAGVGYRTGWFTLLFDAPPPVVLPAAEDTLNDSPQPELPAAEPERPLEDLLTEAAAAYAAQNYGTAFALFEQAAQRGSAEGQYQVGRMYEAGLGVASSSEHAAQWYRRAAEQGHADAEQALAPKTETEHVPEDEQGVPDTTASTAPETPLPAAEEETAPDVYFLVDQMPELIGGRTALQEEIRYPEAARRAGIEGSVIVAFVVDTEGSVIEPLVTRGLGFGCDEEALRVVRAARFKPGRHRDTPVAVHRSLTITFKRQ